MGEDTCPAAVFPRYESARLAPASNEALRQHVLGWLILNGLDVGQNRSASFYPGSFDHSQVSMPGQDYIDPGTKLDETYPLAALEKISYLVAEDNAPGQNAGDLGEGDIEFVSTDGDHVLLVFGLTLGSRAFRRPPFW